MTDQQQYATAGPAADGRSPRLAQLASQGAWFRRAYTATTPCSPARASVATGVYPHRHGMLNNCHVPYAIAREIAPDCDTWGRHLTEVGYRVRYVGKWHVGFELGPAEHGFDTENRRFNVQAYRWRLGLPDDVSQGTRGRRPDDGRPTPDDGRRSSTSEAPAPDVWGFFDAAGLYWRHYGRQDGPVEATATAMQAEAGLEQLRALTKDGGAAEGKPWCLWTNFSGPHNPYIVPEPYAAMYDWHDVPLPPSFGADPTGKPAYVRRVRERWFGQIGEEHTRKAIAHYWGYCTMIDHHVGRLLDFLDKSGQAQDTLVVFTSDHGDMLGAHNLWFKDVYGYEETHRLPLVMRWPRVIRAGTVVDLYARTLDLGPTFLDAAGARPLEPCHGTSLLPLLEGEPGARQAPERRELFVQEHGNIFNFTMRQISNGRYKLTWNAFDDDELYDLQEDPHELRNLAQDSTHRRIYQRLCDRLWDWMLRLEDPYSGRQYAANVMLPRSAPPPLRPDRRGRTAEERGTL